MGRKRRRKRSTTPKPKKRKKVTVKLLDRVHAGKTTEPYRLMDGLINEKHEHLKDAKIAIAWRFGWTQDADGRLKLGQVKKGSDLDREMHQHDFVILLNHEAWNRGGLNEEQRLAWVDHQLCHCQVVVDANGEPKTDEQGRTVWRIRKHDIEEFQDIVARHGLYSGDLEKFAQAGLNDADRPLLPLMEGREASDKAASNTPSSSDSGDDTKVREIAAAKKKLAAEKKRRAAGKKGAIARKKQ